ncbi:MAG: hypothetical protein C0507_08645 [Cyanobacteria bacterium PR.3.49]|nr:hypothetical protein [Cyanobacteria bacterium PR.3.49]
MADVITTAQAQPQLSNEAQQALLALRAEMDDHRAADNNRSYLGKAFDWLYTSDEKSFKKMEELEQRAATSIRSGDLAAVEKMQDEVRQAVDHDKSKLNRQADVSFLGSSGLKIGALFFGGPIGWGATAALYMADEAKPKDKVGTQMIDATLGAAKGLAFKGMLTGIMGSSMNIALKGGAMSLGGRGIDTALTRSNYYDQKEQQYSLWQGVKATGKELGNVEHLAVDAAVMGTAFAGGWALGVLAPKLMTPFSTKIATSSMAGASRGMISEISAARVAGEEINWARVAGKGLATSLVYGFAAVPGALQADYAIRHQHDHAGDGNFIEYKKAGTVKAEQLTHRAEWKSTNGDPLTGEIGDWKLTGPDGSTWTVKPDIFAKTYGEVEPGSGVYAKTALARAMKLKMDYSVNSLEGKSSGVAGDYLVIGPNNEPYIVNGTKFEGMYQQVPTKGN